jgi:hypothetical protein
VDGEQACGALAEGVVCELKGAGQIQGLHGGFGGGQVAARVVQQPVGDGVIGSDLFDLPGGEELPDPVPAGLPGH